ncbi:MAG: hypothetical protein ACW96M_00995, partial [Candidatus Thorarchaeota archaeon]
MLIQITTMNLFVSKKSVWQFIATRRSTILRRLLIYFIILLILFPFVFVNRTEIFRTFLERNDRYIYTINQEGLVVTDFGFQGGEFVGPQITTHKVSENAISYHKQILDGNASASEFFNN